MQPWFEADPGIFEEEKRILEALGYSLDSDLLSTERRVVFRGASAADPQRQLEVIYPSCFPSFPPDIRDDGSQPLLQRHQLAFTRGFCLFGPDRYRWRAAMNGGDAVKEAEDLIRIYRVGMPLPANENVPEPISDLLPTLPFGGFLIPPDLAEILAQPVDKTIVGECDLIITNSDASLRRGIVLGIALGRTKSGTDRNLQQLLAGERTIARNATLVRLAAPPPLIDMHGAQPWLDLIAPRPGHSSKSSDEWFLFVYPEESRRTGALGVGFTVLQVHAGTRKWNCFRCFILRPDFTRIPGFEPLGGKKVMIIGVGALGSRIAYCLSTSGVGHLILVDHDVYDPANAVRHECGFAPFGLAKVEAVRRRVLQANYRCSVSCSTLRIGEIPPHVEADLANVVSGCDLVINATAYERASHWLDRFCGSLGKTCLHASVTNGAWGGEVIRVIPGKTPCWVCHQVGHEPPATEPQPDEGVYPPGCAHPTFTGSLPEVSIVADLAATMAIETLLNRPGRDFAGSHIRWCGRSATGACQPSIEVVTPVPDPECPVCSPESKSPGMSS